MKSPPASDSWLTDPRSGQNARSDLADDIAKILESRTHLERVNWHDYARYGWKADLCRTGLTQLVPDTCFTILDMNVMGSRPFSYPYCAASASLHVRCPANKPQGAAAETSVPRLIVVP